MTENLIITLGQLNLVVGGFEENLQRMLAAHAKAEQQNADLIIFPELSVTGYPPEDLVRKPVFYQKAMEIVRVLQEKTRNSNTALLIGTPWHESNELYNAALLLEKGEIVAQQFKHDLPNYGVFDERRIFSAGPIPTPIGFHEVQLGIMICEDMWHNRVMDGVKGADILISMNASPFEVGKHQQRLDRAAKHVRTTGKPLIYVNQLCAQDDLVFDGDSFVMSCEETLHLRLSRTEESIESSVWHKNSKGHWEAKDGLIKNYTRAEEVMYQALVLGLKDYIKKNNFPGVIIGMSGGIDSALSAAVAVDALGADRVRLVMMPSRFTSKESLNDAQRCADMLGVTLENIPIEDTVMALEDTMHYHFEGRERDIAEENMQSRIRGVILMALSNKFGSMVLSTGNKSEMAVGYATLYGDMCGGYNVLKDVYKVQVFDLARWRNNAKPENGIGPEGCVIPDNIITKAPTAELRPDQKDEDSLPPYEILDAILMEIIEEERSLNDVVAMGYNHDTVHHVCRMLYGAEYKRRQSPPGVKVSRKPFGRDRRYPITNSFRE